MNKLLTNRSFLTTVCSNPHRAIKKATTSELNCITEICANIKRIPFSVKEAKLVTYYKPIINTIGKNRNVDTARDLIKHIIHILPTLVKAALGKYELR